MRFGIAAATPLAFTLAGIVRVKWLASHLEPAGIGVLGQITAGQVWLGVGAALGLAFPLTQRVAAARGAGDADRERRAVWSAFALVACAIAAIAALGLAFAGPIAAALLDAPVHAPLVRLSLIGMAGYALFSIAQGWMAGHSDVRAPLTLAITGGAASVIATVALVPGWGLAGAVVGGAMLYPTGLLAVLLVHRSDYVPRVTPRPRPVIDRGAMRVMLAVGAGSLALALADQGALLALRAHYVRVHGLAANGLVQAALALSQQAGGVFYVYLASYAFGRVSALPTGVAMRDFTRTVGPPVVGLAAVAVAVAMVIAGPVLRLFYSDLFEPAQSLLRWTLLGEFGRVAMQTWALASLPIGGVRLWLPIMLSSPLVMVLAYAVLHVAGAGPRSLPGAYAAAGLGSLLVAAWAMGRHGVTPSARDAALLFAAIVLLTALAWTWSA
jgi:O-antigen/teichoic acid export membrane protein